MNSLKKIIGILLLVAGAVLISIPFYIEWNGNKEVKALEEALSLISESDGSEVDLSSIKDLSLSEEEIGDVLELEIPAIDLKQHVLGETTDENLNLALTQIKTDQSPGTGNFTIAGHRGFKDGRHFSKLAKVPVGEKVYLHENSKSYVYEITSSEVIEATAVDILNDREDMNEITMITCTVTGLNRVAVKGELIDIIKRK